MTGAPSAAAGAPSDIRASAGSSAREEDSASASVIDPITLAVLEGGLQSAIREMREVLVRSGRSPIIAISTDFSNSIFDARGEQVIQGDDQPVHLGSMQVALGEVIRFFEGEVSEGDVIYVNDPTYGGGHQADMTMFKPVYLDGALEAWVGTRAHVSDSGGPVAGGYNPLAREIYAEGIRISPLKIWEQGELRRDVLTMLLLNLRTPEAHRGDMGAQLGALRVAERRLGALSRSLGTAALREGMTALLDRGELMARQAIDSLPDGAYPGHALLENPSGGEPLEIWCEITVDGERLAVALRGSDQIDRYMNSYFGNSISAIYAGLLTVFPKDTPHNGGVYRCVDIDLGPPGSIINAVEPTPSSMATSTPFDNIMEAVESSLAQAAPERAVAGWSHFCGSTFAGLDSRTGERFSHLSTMSGIGGAGAMWRTDGWSCCSPQCTFGGMRTGNVEEIEFRIPMHIHRFEFRPDSEGPGQWRGGFGVVLEMEPLEPKIVVSNIGEGYDLAPPGLGVPEALDGDRATFERRVRDADGTEHPIVPHTVIDLHAGEVLVSESPGGGGIGDPRQRDRAALEADIDNGLISPQRAARVYGRRPEHEL